MNHDDLTDRLDAALDALLAARGAAGGLVEAAVPGDALDAAFGTHEGFQEARRALSAAIEGLVDAGADRDAVLTVEAAAHHLAAQAAEVGWRLRVTADGRRS